MHTVSKFKFFIHIVACQVGYHGLIVQFEFEKDAG